MRCTKTVERGRAVEAGDATESALEIDIGSTAVWGKDRFGHAAILTDGNASFALHSRFIQKYFFLSVPRLSPLVQLIAVAVTAHVALGASRVTTALYALSLHASEFTVGSLIALFAVFPMFLAVPMGRTIDRIGIRKPMMAGCLLASAGVISAALIQGLTVLYFSAVLIGTGFMAIFISAQHAVGALAPPDSRAASFSKLSLGFSVSSFAGPLIAGFVIDHSHYSVAFWVCGGFTLAAFLLAAGGALRQIAPHQGPHASRVGGTLALLREPDLRRIYIVGILLAAAWDLFTFVTPIRGSQLGFSASVIGMILASFSAATFLVRLIMPYITRHFHEWQVLTGALAIATLCYALMPFMRQPLTMAAVAAGLGLALGTGQPNVLALLHQCAPSGRGAEAIGIRATIGNASSVMLPLAFGAAGATLGLFAVFWGLGALIACGIPLAANKAFMNNQHTQGK
jgi:predicted MFS family arabinose efflux permease